jgi:hypothetical protein
MTGASEAKTFLASSFSVLTPLLMNGAIINP